MIALRHRLPVTAPPVLAASLRPHELKLNVMFVFDVGYSSVNTRRRSHLALTISALSNQLMHSHTPQQSTVNIPTHAYAQKICKGAHARHSRLVEAQVLAKPGPVSGLVARYRFGECSPTAYVYSRCYRSCPQEMARMLSLNTCCLHWKWALAIRGHLSPVFLPILKKNLIMKFPSRYCLGGALVPHRTLFRT